jgi:hypothetical protein
MTNCSDIETLISAYADNELSSDTREKVREHIETCNLCGVLLKIELASKKSVRRIPIIPAPSHLKRNILEMIQNSAVNESGEKFSALSFFRFFKQNVVYASAAVILIFIGVFFIMTHFFINGKMTPFISSVYAYHVENNTPIDLTGTTEDIEKILAKTLERDIPIPLLDGIDLTLIGGSTHSDVEGRHCAALRYKNKNGEEITHFVICCTKVPIEKLQKVEGKPEYWYTSKDDLNIIFWKCQTTHTTRCIAAVRPLNEVVKIADVFCEKAAEHFAAKHSDKN